MKPVRALVIVALIAAVLTLSGCITKWSVDAVQYGISDFIYTYDDTGWQIKSMAADDYDYLIMKVSLVHNGLTSDNIRDELIFAVYDQAYPTIPYLNFYEASAPTLYDALQELYMGRGSDMGSVFFMIPEGIAEADIVFKVMDKEYNLINQVGLFYVPEREYPTAW